MRMTGRALWSENDVEDMKSYLELLAMMKPIEYLEILMYDIVEHLQL